MDDPFRLPLGLAAVANAAYVSMTLTAVHPTTYYAPYSMPMWPVIGGTMVVVLWVVAAVVGGRWMVRTRRAGSGAGLRRGVLLLLLGPPGVALAWAVASFARLFVP